VSPARARAAPSYAGASAMPLTKVLYAFDSSVDAARAARAAVTKFDSSRQSVQKPPGNRPHGAQSMATICSLVRTRAMRGNMRRMSCSWLSCSGEVQASEAITTL
jgi:hypothetical protein